MIYTNFPLYFHILLLLKTPKKNVRNNIAEPDVTVLRMKLFIHYLGSFLFKSFLFLLRCVSRQCLCCFKEYKHLEVFNQLVYALINLVIAQISSLRDRLCSVQDHIHKGGASGAEGAGSEWSGGGETAPGPLPQPSSPGEDEPVNVERDSAEEDADTPDQNQNKSQSQGHGQGANQQSGEAQMEALGPGEGCSSSSGGSGGGDGCAGAGGSGSSDSQDPFSSWSTEEREKLLLCAAKIFQIQFPLYTAYKHNTHPTIEVRTSPTSIYLALIHE